ncbi:MAG: YjbQ family protein [Thermoplasmata archaeon]|nr:MAG: YjbQ family protein [Thermoplasmata archaeon]
METLSVRTGRSAEVVDVTGMVEGVVRSSGVTEGIAVVHTPHTTTAVVVNEREGGLTGDLLEWSAKVAPKGAGYRHDGMDGNAHAHLRAMMLGASATIPIAGGRLALGTWQSVLFVELDGPRDRRLNVQVIGDR